jgi:very-short-patch-repair endonuclease
MDVRRLARLARAQLGLFTRAQAGGCGFSPYQVRRRLAAGAWRAVVPGVLADASLRDRPEVLDRAAQLAVPGSVLAGPAAARVWGMPVPPLGPVLIVDRRTARRPPETVMIRASLDPRDVQVVEGARVTSRARTVVDCLRLLPDAAALEFLDRALQQEWVRLDDLVAWIQANVGRHGTPRLVRLVRTASSGARSAAERVLALLMRRAGITGWTLNATIVDEDGVVGVGDAVFRAANIIIEIDGWAYHATAERFQADRARQNRLVRAGWTVLRFTWRDLTGRPGHVVATIRQTLSRQTVTGQTVAGQAVAGPAVRPAA